MITVQDKTRQRRSQIPKCANCNALIIWGDPEKIAADARCAHCGKPLRTPEGGLLTADSVPSTTGEGLFEMEDGSAP